MVDPISATAAISIGASAAGAGISGIGAMTSGEANAGAYRYKAGVALLNKQINEQNAQWATQAGGIHAMESGLKSRQDIAKTKVIQSGSGFDVNTGSNKAVRDTQSDVARFDQNVISWDASKTSFGYLSKAATDQAEANLDQMAAEQSEKAGLLGMIGSFISGAGNVSGKWMQGKSAGAFA